MNDDEPRIYIRGTTNPPPPPRDFGGRRRIYKHFDQDNDTLYYQHEGKWYCIVDDKPARGYQLPTGMFLPEDFNELISYEQAKAMCATAGVYFPKPLHKIHGHRTPPPLFLIHTPTKRRPAWNRSAIQRHITETLNRKQEANG